MLVDSHCHLNFPELKDELERVLEQMRTNDVGFALCVNCCLEEFDDIAAIAAKHDQIYASVGVHPNYRDVEEPDEAALISRAEQQKVIAIGETGLDYYRTEGDLEWQKQRFRTHIRAARRCEKPLIIHMRNAAEDTLRIMREEGASEAGGVMHCFSESLEVAEAAMEMNFFISFSGIVTFANAKALKEVARNIPLKGMLMETDSPYLAPVPYRGKTNQPAYVKHVAEEIAKLHETTLDEVASQTTANFMRLFKL
ncbi:MAG: TatD family hydrolase [Burkholderiales bacterium]